MLAISCSFVPLLLGGLNPPFPSPSCPSLQTHPYRYPLCESPPGFFGGPSPDHRYPNVVCRRLGSIFCFLFFPLLLGLFPPLPLPSLSPLFFFNPCFSALTWKGYYLTLRSIFLMLTSLLPLLTHQSLPSFFQPNGSLISSSLAHLSCRIGYSPPSKAPLSIPYFRSHFFLSPGFHCVRPFPDSLSFSPLLSTPCFRKPSHRKPLLLHFSFLRLAVCLSAPLIRDFFLPKVFPFCPLP